MDFQKSSRWKKVPFTPQVYLLARKCQQLSRQGQLYWTPLNLKFNERIYKKVILKKFGLLFVKSGLTLILKISWNAQGWIKKVVPRTANETRSLVTASWTRSLVTASATRSLFTASGTRSLVTASGTRSLLTASGTRSLVTASVTRSLVTASGTRS